MSDARPNVARALEGLKGFQRTTVEYAFDRLYLDKDSSHRFLVADEVGLGKTLVARGVVAKTIDHLWDDNERIDIVYICSNVNIARQNIRRLGIGADTNVMKADRLTMLPASLRDLKKHKVNFIAFTPGTSFNLRSSMGRWEERVVLYAMMQRVWHRSGVAPMNVFQGGVQKSKWFRNCLQEFERCNTIDRSISKRFAERLRQQVRDEQAAGRPHLRKRYDDLCHRFQRIRKNIPEEDWYERAALIGELRSLLAATCVDALEPDLVILDEFQRFKPLLNGDDEAATLAKGLFEYQDDTTEVRILLLSATPYKMYTLHHEAHEDDHYEDFLRTVDFIEGTERPTGVFEHLLGEYRRELYRLGNGGNVDRLRQIKDNVETHLRKYMCRTERVRSTEQHDGMLVEKLNTCTDLRKSDVKAFRLLQDIASRLDKSNVVEYWKSVPYLLSFMDQYRLKKRFKEALDTEPDVATRFRASPELQPSWLDFDRYGLIDPQNPRLRWLFKWLEEAKAWRLLWVPPTLQYTQLEEPFATAQAAAFTKRLIFSSWAVVPKTIASLVSYEAERRAFREYEKRARNTREARKRRQPLLRYAVTRGRLTGMPNLGILYPSIALAELVDPMAIASGQNSLPTVSDTLARIREVFEPHLQRLVVRHATYADHREDEAWYWAAPILLDVDLHENAAHEWLQSYDLPQRWQGPDADDDPDSRWADHVGYAAAMARGEHKLGKPPADLVQVLSLLALAGPGTVAARALTRRGLGGASASEPWLRDAAAQIAWGFRSLFNLFEAIAVVRRNAKTIPYWRRALEYGAAGCLQAVVDEHAHLVRDLEGLTDKDPEVKAEQIALAMQEALSLRASTSQADQFDVDEGGSANVEARRLRNNFALRFGNQRTEDGSDGVRTDRVRGAFNSPYRPFVLATTSFGQEGLDFHAYSHAVVHWNLPSNPVDLEQREGRVHRFKGHAVRKNVADCYGKQAIDASDGDAWDRLFELAAENICEDGGGLKPYWVFPGNYSVERHVPRLPLSREELQLAALQRSLAVYRMVFGQPRQDDLMAFLLDRLGEKKLQEIAGMLQINLSPGTANDT